MSAFLVNEQTIQHVVSMWFPATEIPSRPVEELDSHYSRLWSMNADAVAQRYGGPTLSWGCATTPGSSVEGVTEVLA